jgi:hypothetical protein
MLLDTRKAGVQQPSAVDTPLSFEAQQRRSPLLPDGWLPCPSVLQQRPDAEDQKDIIIEQVGVCRLRLFAAVNSLAV